MRKTSFFVLAPVLLTVFWVACPARAGSPGGLKPVAVVSFSGYNEAKADLAFVGKISGHPELAKGLETLVQLATGGRGLDGLDKDRPWGVVVQLDADKFAQGEREPDRIFSGYLFLPVSDFGALLEVLRPYIGEAEETGEGSFELKKGPIPAYVREVGGWAFVSAYGEGPFASHPEYLADLPKDPAQLLGGIDEQYDLALRLNVDNVPKEVRQRAVAELRRQAEADSRRRPGESDQQYAARKIISRQVMRAIVAAADDLEQITLGWALDQEAAKTYLDVAISARAGTESARHFASLGKTTSDFRGFLLPEATLRANWTGELPGVAPSELAAVIESVRSKALENIDQQGQPDRQAEAAKRLLGGMLDVIQQTVAAGRVDGGAAAVLKPDAVTLAAGGLVADADKLEAALGEVVRLEHPAFVDKVFTTDAASHKDVRFHRVSIPIPAGVDDRRKVVGMIGETVELFVGIGPESAYVAVGKEPLELLKQVIDGSKEVDSQVVPPIETSVALGALAKFVAQVGEGDNRQQAEQVADLLAGSAGADHVNLVLTPIARGVQIRLEIEEGILKAIGATAAKRSLPVGAGGLSSSGTAGL